MGNTILHLAIFILNIVLNLIRLMESNVKSLMNGRGRILRIIGVILNDSIPLKRSYLRRMLIAYSSWMESLYNKGVEYLLVTRLRTLILFYFSSLFYYRYCCSVIYEKYPNIRLIVLIISLIASRLHIAGYFIILALIICRLEMSYNKMAKFYRRDPTRLTKDFGDQLQKRHMRKAAEVIIEAAQNPIVQAVAMGVVGAVTWKSLDVLETYRSAEHAEKDRENASANAEKQREHEKEENALAREAEDRRHRTTLEEDARKHRENLEEDARKHRENLEEEGRKHRENLEEEGRKHTESLAAEAKQRELDRQAEAEQRRLDRESKSKEEHDDQDSSLYSIYEPSSLDLLDLGICLGIIAIVISLVFYVSRKTKANQTSCLLMRKSYLLVLTLLFFCCLCLGSGLGFLPIAECSAENTAFSSVSAMINKSPHYIASGLPHVSLQRAQGFLPYAVKAYECSPLVENFSQNKFWLLSYGIENMHLNMNCVQCAKIFHMSDSSFHASYLLHTDPSWTKPINLILKDIERGFMNPWRYYARNYSIDTMALAQLSADFDILLVTFKPVCLDSYLLIKETFLQASLYSSLTALDSVPKLQFISSDDYIEFYRFTKEKVDIAYPST